MAKLTPVKREWLAKLPTLGGRGQATSPLSASETPVKTTAPGGPTNRTDGGVSETIPTLDRRGAAPVVADDIVEIAIIPEKATLLVGNSQQFNASRESSVGSEDITAAVQWSSSDPSISINASGLATANPVLSPPTVPVQLKATDPISGEFGVASVTVKVPVVAPPPAPREPELQFITISEEAFGGAQTSPLNGTIILGAKRQLYATGVYDDGRPGEDLTKQVIWSTGPEDSVSVSKTGLVTALKLGSGTVKATHPKAKIGNEIHLKVEEDRNPPAAPNSTLLEIEVTPKGALEAYVNEQHPFRATAIYGNGKTDWTKAVDWIASPKEVVEIDIGGNARMKKPGKATISAHVRQPVTALHGDYKDLITSIALTVLAPAPKTNVSLPGASHLTKEVVAALVKNLVSLADPQFMNSDKPVKPVTPSPTGDASVDRLLALTAEVVTKWNDFNTLAEARHIWAQVLPRLWALLKEAEGPKVGVKRTDLNPALDAVDNLTARVKSGPGTVAASHAKTHPQTADILVDVEYVNTPYGELFYLRQNEKDFKRLTDPIVATIPYAKNAYVSLQARLKQQEVDLKPIAPFLKSPDAAKAEITKFASNETIQDAHISDAETDLAETLGDLLKTANLNLEKASRDYSQAETDMSRKEKADKLREEAKELRETVEHVRGVIGGLGETLLGLAEPASVFKGVFETTNQLLDMFGVTKAKERANQLEKEARDLEMASFADHIHNAQLDVDAALTTLGLVTSRLSKVQGKYERDRDFAEEGFDDTCKAKGLNCKFQFQYLRAGLVTAQKSYDAAVASSQGWEGLVVLVDMLVEQYGKVRLQIVGADDPNERPDRLFANLKERNRPATDAIMKDAKKYSAESAQRMREARKLREDLNRLRVTANVAMANAPRRRAH